MEKKSDLFLDPTQRRSLLAFAVRHGVAVVEDDYDSESHDDRPLEPLRTLDRSGRVRSCT